jgi:uncharacterized protein (DUF983 family)
MFSKGSKIKSIVEGSCPKCQTESMYVNKNPYVFMDVLKMHEKCSNCGLKYQIEPSFFYGAMYVSYGLSVALGVAAFVIAKLFIGLSLPHTFIVMVVALIIIYPILLRVSRNIWINFFIDYSEKDE